MRNQEFEIVQWLEDRRKNCLRIAELYVGKDRGGWLEDAEYLKLAIKRIRDLEDITVKWALENGKLKVKYTESMSKQGKSTI